MNIIHKLEILNIIGFDIVEYCAEYDNSMITAFASAKVIREVLGITAKRRIS